MAMVDLCDCCWLLSFYYAYLFIFLFPKISWLRWRYEVRESEIELQHGLFIVKRTLIPMVRVQHVDTSQGPILRKYNLAGITISTAATNHTIPALVMEEADELTKPNFCACKGGGRRCLIHVINYIGSQQLLKC